MVHDLAVGGAVGVGVVGDRAGDGALLEVADVLPAQGDAFSCALPRRQREAGVAFHRLAGEAYGGEALGGGEDDAAVGVVVGLCLVLAHYRELDAVDGLEF